LDREPNKSTDSLATCKMEESRTTTGVANQKTISSVWLTRWNWIYQANCDSYCKKDGKSTSVFLKIRFFIALGLWHLWFFKTNA